MPDPTLPLLYKRPRPLLSDQDGDLSLRPNTGYGFAAAANAVPLMAAEFLGACRHIPIVFADGAVPQPSALLGLRSGENLMVGPDGSWVDSCYIPAYIRRYPFIFSEDGNRSEFTLCIDAAAGLGTGRVNSVICP
jgi:hypothetical protein